MMRRRVLIVGGALALALGGVAATQGRYLYWAAISEPVSQQISVGEAYALAEAGEILLVDIRRPDEWEATGSPMPGQRLDMRREDFAEALLELAGGDADAPVALICARGVRSSRLANRLGEAGFSNIIDVPEGMLGSAAGPGWLREGLPVERP